MRLLNLGHPPTHKGTNSVKLEFDGHQDYQLDAIQAIIDIFEGTAVSQR